MRMGLPETTCLELYVSDTDLNRIIKQNILSLYISVPEVYELLGTALDAHVVLIEHILKVVDPGQHENRGIRIVLKTHNAAALAENLEKNALPFIGMKQLNEYGII